MDAEGHRTEAVEAYNRAWALLGTDHRTADQDADLLTAAFTSRHHWQEVGGAQQWIVADWMVSAGRRRRRHGRARPPVRRAGLRRGRWRTAPTGSRPRPPKGVARAFAAAGDLGQRDAWCAVAVGLVTAIGNKENRAVVAGQLAETAGYRPP